MLTKLELENALAVTFGRNTYLVGDPDDFDLDFAGTGRRCAVRYDDPKGLSRIIGTGNTFAEAVGDAITKQGVERRLGAKDRRANS